MHWRTLLYSLPLAALLFFAAPSHAQSEPPKGFTALFNGKDLTGWHGMSTFDPYKLAAMPEAERMEQLAKWTEYMRKHWTVENGELVNDGHGQYMTTDRDLRVHATACTDVHLERRNRFGGKSIHTFARACTRPIGEERVRADRRKYFPRATRWRAGRLATARVGAGVKWAPCPARRGRVPAHALPAPERGLTTRVGPWATAGAHQSDLERLNVYLDGRSRDASRPMTPASSGGTTSEASTTTAATEQNQVRRGPGRATSPRTPRLGGLRHRPDALRFRDRSTAHPSGTPHSLIPRPEPDGRQTVFRDSSAQQLFTRRV